MPKEITACMYIISAGTDLDRNKIDVASFAYCITNNTRSSYIINNMLLEIKWLIDRLTLYMYWRQNNDSAPKRCIETVHAAVCVPHKAKSYCTLTSTLRKNSNKFMKELKFNPYKLYSTKYEKKTFTHSVDRGR